MKLTAKKGSFIVSVLGIVGIITLVFGSVLFALFGRIIHFFLEKELVLKEGNEFYDLWKEIPIEITQKIYLFNITNPEAFVQNGSSPIVEEIGPYVFKGQWMKENITWNDEDGTVTYRDIKDYTFVPELSYGNQEEIIYTLNAPLLAVINYVEEFTPIFVRSFVVDIMNDIIDSYNETLLVHKTVRELVYEGYHEPMVGDLVKVIEPFVTLPMTLINDTFGILHEKKHIGDGVFTIKSGANGIHDYASIAKWNNKSSVNWWDGETCNQINGTDGVQFTPGVTANSTLHFFNPNLCRSIELSYVKDVTVHGIKTLRFGVPTNVFASGYINPDNECFCSGECYSGLLPMNCKKGAPFVLSLPHFLEVEEEVKQSVNGLKSPTEDDKSFFDIEPNTGVVLNAAFKMQLNGVTRPYPDYRVLDNVSDNIVPVILISEEARIDTFFASYFKKRVQIPILVFYVICIVSIVVGAFWTVSSVVFLFCIRAKVKPDKLKHSVVLKTLNSVYTSVALWPPEEETKNEETKNDHDSEKTRL